jgi:hypothetical protein
MGPIGVIEHGAEIGARAKQAVEEGREAAASVAVSALSDARQIADTARELVPSGERRRANRSRRRWLVLAVLLGAAIGFAVWRARSRHPELASPDELRPSDAAPDRSVVEAVESTAPDAFGAVVVEEQADQSTPNGH